MSEPQTLDDLLVRTQRDLIGRQEILIDELRAELAKCEEERDSLHVLLRRAIVEGVSWSVGDPLLTAIKTALAARAEEEPHGS